MEHVLLPKTHNPQQHCWMQVPWCIPLVLEVVCSMLKSVLGSSEAFDWAGHWLCNVCPAYFTDLVKSESVCRWKSTISKGICCLDILVMFRRGKELFKKYSWSVLGTVPSCSCSCSSDESTLCCSVLHSGFSQYLGDICAPHFVTCDTWIQTWPTPPSPAFSGLCFRLVGLGRAWRCSFHLAGVLWVGPAEHSPPQHGRAPWFGGGWDVPRVRRTAGFCVIWIGRLPVWLHPSLSDGPK